LADFHLVLEIASAPEQQNNDDWKRQADKPTQDAVFDFASTIGDASLHRTSPLQVRKIKSQQTIASDMPSRKTSGNQDVFRHPIGLESRIRRASGRF
jgi:hypothetical protein